MTDKLRALAAKWRAESARCISEAEDHTRPMDPRVACRLSGKAEAMMAAAQELEETLEVETQE